MTLVSDKIHIGSLNNTIHRIVQRTDDQGQDQKDTYILTTDIGSDELRWHLRYQKTPPGPGPDPEPGPGPDPGPEPFDEDADEGWARCGYDGYDSCEDSCEDSDEDERSPPNVIEDTSDISFHKNPPNADGVQTISIDSRREWDKRIRATNTAVEAAATRAAASAVYNSGPSVKITFDDAFHWHCVLPHVKVANDGSYRRVIQSEEYFKMFDYASYRRIYPAEMAVLPKDSFTLIADLKEEIKDIKEVVKEVVKVEVKEVKVEVKKADVKKADVKKKVKIKWDDINQVKWDDLRAKEEDKETKDDCPEPYEDCLSGYEGYSAAPMQDDIMHSLVVGLGPGLPGQGVNVSPCIAPDPKVWRDGSVKGHNVMRPSWPICPVIYPEILPSGPEAIQEPTPDLIPEPEPEPEPTERRRDPYDDRFYTKDEFVSTYSGEVEWTHQDPVKLLLRHEYTRLASSLSNLSPEIFRTLLAKIEGTFPDKT